MNNEIKEILDRLFVYKNENDEMKYQPEDILTIDDLWILLDYITNLQEENEEQKKYFESDMEIRAKLLTRIDRLNYSLEQAYKDIKELQEENERLEKGLEYAKRIEKDYKTKFDKAIEYIELWHYRNDFRVNSFTKGVKEELLKILKGSDKE